MSALAVLAALALSADPEAGRAFAVAPGSEVSYRAVHKLHAVVGLARAVEGRVRILPGGGVQAMVRARVDAFDSGNGNRDAHMREVTEAARYPFVTLKLAGRMPEPTSGPGAMDVALAGELTFHGRTRPVEVTAKVRFDTADRASVEGAFSLSLDAFEVERPSLLFVRIDDRLDLTARLVLEAER